MPEPKICPADHRHSSTTTCYTNHGCRCARCRYHQSQYETAVRAQRVEGGRTSLLLPAEPTVEHVHMLLAAGRTVHQISRTSGLAYDTIADLADPNRDPSRMVKPFTERAVLQVTADYSQLTPTALIGNRGLRRRVEALMTQGWTMRSLAEASGFRPSNFQPMVVRAVVTLANHRRVEAMYEQLWDKTPPLDTPTQRSSYTRSLAIAKRRGYHPPLAWDDIDNDPTPVPCDRSRTGVDEIAVELAISGVPQRLTPEELRLVVTGLHRLKMNDQRIAATAHCSSRQVLRIRRELGLEANYDGYVEAKAA
jgi:lambda repressor-like predicted transcriptional regulator